MIPTIPDTVDLDMLFVLLEHRRQAMIKAREVYEEILERYNELKEAKHGTKA